MKELMRVRGEPVTLNDDGSVYFKGGTPLESRFIAKIRVNPDTECWEWTANRYLKGYGQIKVAGKTLGAHRLSHELFKDRIPDGLCVCHSCDNPPCCNPDHLFLGTLSDNSKDRDRKGRRTKLIGENHVNSFLTETKVRDIRSMYDSGLTMKEIAFKAGISPQHACAIGKRQQWRHVV